MLRMQAATIIAVIYCVTTCSEAAILNVLPFIQLTVNATGFFPDDSDFDEGFVSIQFPQSFYFNNVVYNSASIVADGYISFDAEVFQSGFPSNFPLDGNIIIAPFWDDFDLSVNGNINNEVFSADSIVSKIVSDFINAEQNADFIATSVVVIYWENTCSFTIDDCPPAESNSFQVVFATSNVTLTSFVIFTYECNRIFWNDGDAGVGFSASNSFFYNHPLSTTNNVINIDCINSPVSNWTNVLFNSKTGNVISSIEGPSPDATVTEFTPENDASNNNNVQPTDQPGIKQVDNTGTVWISSLNVCCDPSNIGKFLIVPGEKNANGHGSKRSYIACPNYTPDRCNQS